MSKARSACRYHGCKTKKEIGEYCKLHHLEIEKMDKDVDEWFKKQKQRQKLEESVMQLMMLGYSYKQISLMCNITIVQIYYIIRKNPKCARIKNKRKQMICDNKYELHKKILELRFLGNNFLEIGKICNVSMEMSRIICFKYPCYKILYKKIKRNKIMSNKNIIKYQEKYKNILELRQQGKTYREIANIMDCTRQNIQSIHKRYFWQKDKLWQDDVSARQTG